MITLKNLRGLYVRCRHLAANKKERGEEDAPTKRKFYLTISENHESSKRLEKV